MVHIITTLHYVVLFFFSSLKMIMILHITHTSIFFHRLIFDMFVNSFIIFFFRFVCAGKYTTEWKVKNIQCQIVLRRLQICNDGCNSTIACLKDEAIKLCYPIERTHLMNMKRIVILFWQMYQVKIYLFKFDKTP